MPALRFMGETHDITISGFADAAWLRHGADCYEGKLNAVGDGSFRVTLDGQTHPIWLASRKDRIFMHAFGRHWEFELVVAGDKDAGAAVGSGNTAQASMPGVVIQIAVEHGQSVEEGQSLLIMESMKLQTTIAAWREGTVAEIHVAQGDIVEKGSALISLAKESGQS